MNLRSGLPDLSPRVVLALALIGLGALLVLADLAPLVAAGSERQAVAAGACRIALAPTCHQRPERSLRVGGVPLAACARCVGLHAGGLVAGLALLIGIDVRPSRGRLLVVAAITVLLLDVAVGTWFAWDHALVRLGTGIAFVTAVAVASGSVLEREPMPAARPIPART